MSYKLYQNTKHKSKNTLWQLACITLWAGLLPQLSLAGVKTSAIPTDVSATIVQFSEFEQGVGKSSVTMTITDNYLRIDDKSQSANTDDEDMGFILYNRREKVIYSVSSEEQQIIKISLVPVSIPSPMALKLHSEEIKMTGKPPMVDGKIPRNYHLLVNDKLCFNMVSVAGLMPDVVKVMGAFNQVLAGQQAETLRYIPADLQEGCDLARHTFHPQNHLKNGFPMIMQTIDESGKLENVKRSRSLLNFKQKKVSATLFNLPDYAVVPIN